MLPEACIISIIIQVTGSVFIMSGAKKIRKKLTNSGGFMCFLSALALIFAGLSVTIDFWSKAVYQKLFSTDELDYLTYNYMSILMLDHAHLIFSASLVTFLICVVNKRRKKIGAQYGALLTIISIAGMVNPALLILHSLSSSFRYDIRNLTSDAEVYIFFIQDLVRVLPLVSEFLLFLCGIILWIKAGTDKFSVECAVVKKHSRGEDSQENHFENNEIPQELEQKKQENIKQYDKSESDFASGVIVKEKPISEKFNQDLKFSEDEKNKESDINFNAKKAAPLTHRTEKSESKSLERCPNCKKLVVDKSKFCNSCGQNLNPQV